MDRVILYDVSWKTYQSLLDDREERQTPRLGYDRGALEILSVLTLEHEETNRTIALLVEIVAAAWDVDTLNVGSATVTREDLHQGFDPDSSFYIPHAARMRGKARLDPAVDCPDLMIEVDVGTSSLDKFPVYAGIGVPEVWRFAGDRIRVHVREGGEYRESATSALLPPITAAVLTRFVAESRSLPRPEWFRAVRDWASAQTRASNSEV